MEFITGAERCNECKELAEVYYEDLATGEILCEDCADKLKAWLKFKNNN